ncbi:hypothetical protein EYF80_016502 [Liparis tanakae]|uniref:Uncharacterized protein n=1 Tax=Liparis tanakae TaxID=230148 RepID=A0A4Z2I5K8_9TELE|nr:hypothetical protein EYF80_016502 [Liparis tanakae]
MTLFADAVVKKPIGHPEFVLIRTTGFRPDEQTDRRTDGVAGEVSELRTAAVDIVFLLPLRSVSRNTMSTAADPS